MSRNITLHFNSDNLKYDDLQFKELTCNNIYNYYNIDLIFIFLNSQFQQLQEQVIVDVYFYHPLKNFSRVSHYLINAL